MIEQEQEERECKENEANEEEDKAANENIVNGHKDDVNQTTGKCEKT